ncbi:hypothetical protein EXIGLDRAFT_653277 [Exidia glandulosa HHB12029]|uniref:Pentacotripeptide-repeat region of PRORP domain-containing protein n=1 Tax=Exidia glandulosa HHB12029 TaxID=1314781 RepID=A0A165EAC7_EXIGL|nr:hypothetical protein EXIGLDRAFT_653277 [Exidia glandulosa HHB12029]
MSLPRPLLELAWLRLHAASLLEQQQLPRAFAKDPRFLRANRLVRRMHAMAAVEPPASMPPPMTFAPYNEGGRLDLSDASFLRRSSRPERVLPPMPEQVELKNRLNALMKLPVLEPEVAALEDTEQDGPPLTEEQLRAIYVDLLTPTNADNDALAVEAPTDPGTRMELVEALETRLAAIMEETWRGTEIDGGLAATLLSLRKRIPDPATSTVSQDVIVDTESDKVTLALDSAPADSETEPQATTEAVTPLIEQLQRAPAPVLVPTVADLDMDQPWNRVLGRLNVMLDRWQEDGVIVSVKNAEPVPQAVETEDGGEDVVVMPIGLSVVTLSDWTNILQTAIDAKDVAAGDVALQLMERARIPVDPVLRYRIINITAKAGNVDLVESLLQRHCPQSGLDEKHLHVKAYSRAKRQSEALRLLHKYESDGPILHMKTYQSVITALLWTHGVGESQRRAHAWDLFAHMRYVAHPNLDVKMYSTMIRACALRRPESDAERAMDLWTEMTVDQGLEPTVDAYNAIILSCARNPAYLMEAFRLARTMMDSSRDANGVPHLSPDYHTFIALLQSAKRMGALARVRWLLAELLRMATQNQVIINSAILQQVFHTYATYKPPERGRIAVSGEQSHMDTVPMSRKEVRRARLYDEEEEEETVPSEGGPPGRGQVLAEAQALFERVVTERKAGSGILSTVQMETMLSNAYLSVFTHHASFERTMEVFQRAFLDLGIEPDRTTFSQLMLRARTAVRDNEPHAIEKAREIFALWERSFGSMSPRRTTSLLDSPQGAETHPVNQSAIIEVMWCNMIECLAFVGMLDEAMTLLHKFETLYPPLQIRDALPQDPQRVMRTQLMAERPLVRFSTTTDAVDDTVQPMILFRRVEVLHGRLIMKERAKDIKYLTWLTNAYKGNLMVRRDRTWGRERWYPKEPARVKRDASGVGLAAPKLTLLQPPVFRKGEKLTVARARSPSS